MITNKMNVSKGLIAGILLFTALGADAAALSIRPFLIDKTVEARDIITEEITLVNETGGKMNIYSTVNEITVDSEGDIKEFVSPVMTDRTNTVTSWVEVKRGRITLEAGEATTTTLTLRVHPQAKPGEYHMFIGFVPAQKAYQAEEAAMRGDADGVIVKLSIEDKSEEFLRVTSYLVDRFVIRESQRVIEVEVENLGDTPEVPKGEIIFFNSLGEELTVVGVNEAGVTVPPGEKVTLTAAIPFGNELGRYKANLSLQYGTKQKATVYDTTQFFMMPLHIMIIVMVSIIALSFLIVWLLRRSLTEKDDDDTHGTDLPFYVRDGHEPKPKDHDIDLSKKV